MVRTYKRKNDRSSIFEKDILSAINDVLEDGLSVRNAAKRYNLKIQLLKIGYEKSRKESQRKWRYKRGNGTQQSINDTATVEPREEEEKIHRTDTRRTSENHKGVQVSLSPTI